MPDRPSPGITTPAHPIGKSQDGCDKSTTGLNNILTTQHKTTQRTTKTINKRRIQLATNITTIGTWNVRTLNGVGKIQELTRELDRYRWDIIGLAETRWKNSGEVITDEGHKIVYSGQEKYHQQGVDFIVRKELTTSILNYSTVSSRIISIRLASQPVNMTIIQIYAPTSDYNDEDIEVFYEDIEQTMAAVHKKDLLIIQGDWNAIVGDANKDWSNAVGKFALGKTNPRGIRLLEFATKHNFTLSNTLHPQKDSRKATWHSPNGRTHNQIDYILAPLRFKSSIHMSSTRTYPGAVINSDHDLVLCNMRLKLRSQKMKKSNRIRYDLEKLNNATISLQYKEDLKSKLSDININEISTDNAYTQISQSLTSTAENVLGKYRIKKQPWITDEMLTLCDKRRSLKSTKHQSTEHAEEYKRVHNLIRRSMKEKKEDWLKSQCNSIDHDLKRGVHSKRAYNTIKAITNSIDRKMSNIEDANGVPIEDDSARLERWTEYCRDLYNYPIKTDQSKLHNTREENEEQPLPILKEEVINAIRTLKNGKSPGIDNVPGELIKGGGEALYDILTKLCQKIWSTNQWPEAWTTSLIIPIPKKGDLKKCSNYRTISLISHTSKIVLRIILNRLTPQAEDILADEQAGFRKDRSTTEQILNCRILMEKHMDHQRQVYHNFIDFKKAFDRVWHDGLWNVMSEFGIDNDLVKIIKSLYESAKSAVLLNNQIGTKFDTTVGVRQGCLLSPVLFNIFLEKIMQDSLVDQSSSIAIGGRKINNLRFADDIDLIAGSESELQSLTDSLEKASTSYGMEINHEKSKILVNGDHSTPPVITMYGKQLENVQNFKYLGAMLTDTGNSKKEIQIRLATAVTALVKLEKIWRSGEIDFKLKYRLYISLVISTLLYGCESWTLLEESKKKIRSFESKAHRRLLNISYKQRKTNIFVSNEINKKVGPYVPLLDIIMRRKMTKFGHITRHDSLANTILHGYVEGERKRGRPKRNWMNDIFEFSHLSLRQLLDIAKDRSKWRKLCYSLSCVPPTMATSRD